MLNRFFAIRLITTIVVVFTVINAFAYVGIGVFTSIEAFIGIYNGEVHTETRPGLKILESLDIFLIALVFLIFAIGIAKLFHPNSDETLSGIIPSWLNINNFTELKMILWEAILTTMVVMFASDIVKRDGKFDWTMLIIPGSIFLLSASMYVLKKAEGSETKEESKIVISEDAE